MEKDRTASPQAGTQKTPSLGILEGTQTPSGSYVIRKVDKFGSVAKAGILAGDEIVAMNDRRLEGSKEEVDDYIGNLIKQTGVGGTLRITVLRGGTEQKFSVQLRAKKTLGLSLDEVSEVLERKISP